MKKIKIGGVEFEVEDKVEELVRSQEVRATTAEGLAGQAAPVLAALEGVTGHKDVGQAIAAINGLKDKAAQADVLATENGKLKAELSEVAKAKKAAEITAMLDGAAADGRLTPDIRKKITGENAPAFAQDPVQLKAYLDVLPKVLTTEGTREVKTDDKIVALSDEEKRIATSQRISPEHVAVFKAGGPEALRKLLEAEKAAKAK